MLYITDCKIDNRGEIIFSIENKRGVAFAIKYGYDYLYKAIYTNPISNIHYQEIFDHNERIAYVISAEKKYIRKFR